MGHPLPLTPDGTLLLRVGFEIAYDCPQPTPMILALNIHYSRSGDLVQPDLLITRPAVAAQSYRDLFGNWCSRIVAPAGKFVLTADALVRDAGLVDTQAPWAQQVPVEHLPEETLVFLLGSRYCETDQLAEIAWKHFGNGPTGWQRVQAICDFVHQHIEFGYHHARRTRKVQLAGACIVHRKVARAGCNHLAQVHKFCAAAGLRDGVVSHVDLTAVVQCHRVRGAVGVAGQVAYGARAYHYVCRGHTRG